jgi:hypothetical protein
MARSSGIGHAPFVLRRIGENLCAALSANAVGSFRFDDPTIGSFSRMH